MTEEQFLKDVAEHKMTVLLDNGIYRHLRFASTGKYPWNQWFDIVTWPGYLAYSGDMGCFVFSRLTDMFEFFRTRPRDDKAKLHINLEYWSEKLEGVDRCGGRPAGARQFSPESFRARVEEAVKSLIEDESLTKSQAKELREEVESEVLWAAGDGEYEAHRVLRDFTCEIDGKKLEFYDTWEWDLQEYTVRFIWCCYAIAWAIQQYDATKEMVGAGA
jgi:hypothetical protein